MNTKKNKNKNKPRPVNPTPSQVEETSAPQSEDIAEEKPEVVIKSDERVPEIISEVIRPPVEEKCVESETPKKPKRNRGKKKKTDKGDDEDFEENKAIEGITDISETKESKKEEGSVQVTELPNVTPTARKKKNKNKKHSESEETKSADAEKVKLSIDNVKNEETNSALETSKEPLEAEVKIPKKKNKKKNRNDSEKSDKAEEVISCTSAFQKILEPRDDKKDVKTESKAEDKNKSSEITEPISATDAPSNVVIEHTSTQNVEEEKIFDSTKEEHGKSKKKNKKEKKQELKAELEKDLGLTIESKVSQDMQSEPKEIEANVILNEEISKSKAKIAKPVEKKRKGKLEETTDITPVSEISASAPQDKVIKFETKGDVDVVEPVKDSAKATVELDTQKRSEKLTIESETDKATTETETDTIQAPTTGMGKKKKKSPKPPQITPEQPQVDKEIKSQCVKHEENLKDTTPEIKTDTTKASENQGPLKSSTLMAEEVSTKPETKDFTENSEKQFSLIVEVKPSSSLEVECKPEPMHDKDDKKHDKDDKKAKNKNKSPKMPKKFETRVESEARTFEPIKKEKCQETTDETYKATSESPSFTSLLEDVEIRSVKAEESEGSICDIVPDVQYPRASSLDNNNNIMIQDISTDFTEKLSVPVNIPDTPLITGSGETPSTTPAVSGVTITEISTKTDKPFEEKTDLKSKVMEVNKDMEDLRLSIERSLAELTAIEKSEQKLEEKFEESQKKDKAEEGETKKDDVVPVKTQSKSEDKDKSVLISSAHEDEIQSADDKAATESVDPPNPPARRDNKGKGKSKKKGKQESAQQTITTTSASAAERSAAAGSTSASCESKDVSKDPKEKDDKSEQKTDQQKGKQQCDSVVQDNAGSENVDFEPIENFEDAMTTSADDVNKSFEMIANEDNNVNELENDKISLAAQNNPEINVTAPIEDDEKADDNDKINPVSQPKNLLGRPDIPVRLNKTDYKKEKHKTPNARQARVNIKDSVPIDKESKESQTEFKRYMKDKSSMDDTVSCTTSENEEFVYKYSFRKVFLPSACHVCKKELQQSRVPCGYCNLVFYCSSKHKDEDYAQHQGFCFAVSTIVHLKNQKHIYADAQNIAGHDYRLLRMQMIVSCEKVLKRKLTACEQEILLYPRICADVGCREWRQSKLKDCDGCGQISFCSDSPDHFPKSHQRWCKSYSLYQKLVSHQQTRGRLEPRLPTRVMSGSYQIPDKINEVLASMYEEKIDMNDIQYASLTQIATAPLTAAYCQQLYTNKMNSTYANGVHKKSTYTLHVVGAELQFEADALNKWEVFFLHLRPDLSELRVVLIGQDLNPSNLPLELLGKIRLCANCRQNKRRVIFDFQDGKSYQEYWSTDFITPDLVCAFNPSIQRSSIYNGRDQWASAIKCILKLKVPFVVTSYTLIELHRDLARIKEVSDIDLNVISEPNYNSFASVRPDRNFISDDEMPLLFKNYCFMLISGAL